MTAPVTALAPYCQGTLAHALAEVAGNPTRENLALLPRLALQAHRIERSLDAMVNEAMEDARLAEAASNVVRLRMKGFVR